MRVNCANIVLVSSKISKLNICYLVTSQLNSQFPVNGKAGRLAYIMHLDIVLKVTCGWSLLALLMHNSLLLLAPASATGNLRLLKIKTK